MNDEIETLSGIPVRSEKIEFDTSQLIGCKGCGRPNPPNRAECIYCGIALPVTGGTASELKLRSVEHWEKAFNLILVGGTASEVDLDSLPFDSNLIRRAIELSPPVPIGRFATPGAAASLNQRLDDAGLRSVVVADEDLDASHPPIRLRSLSARDDRFILTKFNTNERVEFRPESLKLLVVGRLFEERSEQTLKKKRGGVKEIEGRNVSKDSGVVDIYFAEEPGGFRIMESGFDFSGLGERKSFIAAENIKALVDLLKIAAPSAAVSTDYVSKRSFIESVWSSTMQNASKGLQRAGFGLTVEKAELSSNEEQFTKYSRTVMLTI